MKTKLNLLILLVLTVFVSCNKVDVNPPQEEVKPNIDDKFIMTTPYNVEIKSGHVTRVTLGEERLALTDIPMTIDIPKAVTKARSESDELKVEFLPYDEVPEFVKGSGTSNKTHVLMFEDTRKGDYDYNDLVVLVKHTFKIEKEENDEIPRYVHDFNIKPLALGATKRSIKFGYQDVYTEKFVYFSNDVREDYFPNDNKTEEGNPKMINTSRTVSFKAPLPDNLDKVENLGSTESFVRFLRYSYNKTNNTPSYPLMGGYYIYSTDPLTVIDVTKVSGKVNYFIEVYDENGVKEHKIFIAEVGVGSGAQRPYGLAIPSSIKTYPYESQNIGKVFPRFGLWVNNTDSNLDWYKDGENGETGFDIDSALYRWYDNQ